MTCSDKLFRFANAQLESARASLKVLSAKLEGARLGQGGEYEITHASYLKTVTIGPYYLSDIPLMPVKGTVSSKFGYRTHPITGKKDFHTGIDLAAAKGTDIEAAFYGVVAETGYNNINGNYVMILHSNTVCTTYCHLDSVDVKVGDTVKRGARIGQVGQTGLATGPHLHFELTINGVRVDPAPALGL